MFFPLSLSVFSLAYIATGRGQLRTLLWGGLSLSLILLLVSGTASSQGLQLSGLFAAFLFCTYFSALFIVPSKPESQWVLVSRFILLPPLALCAVLSALPFLTGAGAYQMDPAKGAHLGLLCACIAFAVANSGAAYGLWLQDYYLKSRRLNVAGNRVPSLTSSDQVCYRLSGATFILLTFSIISALILVRARWGHWIWEPRSTIGLGLWLVYGLAFHLRKTGQIGSRGFAAVPFVFVLAVAVITVFGMAGGFQ